MTHFIIGCMVGTTLGLILTRHLNKLWESAHEDEFKTIRKQAHSQEGIKKLRGGDNG